MSTKDNECVNENKCAFIGCDKKATGLFTPEGSSMFVIRYPACEEHSN